MIVYTFSIQHPLKITLQRPDLSIMQWM